MANCVRNASANDLCLLLKRYDERKAELNTTSDSESNLEESQEDDNSWSSQDKDVRELNSRYSRSKIELSRSIAEFNLCL